MNLALVLILSVNQSWAPNHQADSSHCSGKFDKDSLRHGVWVCRYNKKVIKREKFKHGRSLGYILYNDKGRMIESSDRKGKVRKYKDCGC